MLLAGQDYPLLNLFWTMLVLFLWILWFFLLFKIFADIFRSSDLSGWGKAGWSIFVILVPFLGVFVYVIARGSKMTEHDMKQAADSEQAFRSYVQQAAVPGASTADEIAKFAALRDSGAITPEEFAAQKAKILG